MAALLSLIAGGALAQESARSLEIRAAFVYNFAKFIEWPAHSFSTPTAPLHLCALSDSRKSTHLELIAGRAAQGHPITLQWIDSPQQTSNCQMLYFTLQDQIDHPQWIAQMARQPVLTIGESEGFIEAGGMVALYVEQNHVRFSINQTVAQASGLKISARLLQLAQDVR